MDKTTLVEQDMKDGRKLIQALDKAGFPIEAALWYYLTESEVWRLMIASPRVDQRSSREASTFVQSVLAKLPKDFGITLTNISVVSPKEELIRLLKAAIHTGPHEIAGIRFSRNVIDNTFIDDAYIYRVH
jgi:hypothetical protein